MSDGFFEGARVLIVDDEPANRVLLERLLEGVGVGAVRAEASARNIVDLVAAFQPDVVLLDVHMPGVDGLEALELLAAHDPEYPFRPVVLLTADTVLEVRRRGLELGARDFLTKPFDAIELRLRVRNLLELRSLHQDLEHRIHARTVELVAARSELVDRLSLAAEFRDDETHEHTLRVGAVAERLALQLDWPTGQATMLRVAAPLHDLGKLGIPDAILLKPGPLTDEEFERMKAHVTIGAELLTGSSLPLFQLAEEIALAHHERWDGTGYRGLSRLDIPPAARIVAVADVFDALTHERPYKSAWPVEAAIEEILSQRGRQFDPDAVDAFAHLAERGELAVDDLVAGKRWKWETA